jgi:hypothetical protein
MKRTYDLYADFETTINPNNPEVYSWAVVYNKNFGTLSDKYLRKSLDKFADITIHAGTEISQFIEFIRSLQKDTNL